MTECPPTGTTPYLLEIPNELFCMLEYVGICHVNCYNCLNFKKENLCKIHGNSNLHFVN